MTHLSFSQEFRRGFLDIAPLLFGVAPFGLLFGTLAAQKGLSPIETILMCVTVYAGGAQFVSIDVWSSPVPVLAVVAATALANTRYFLMGAALRPHVATLPTGMRWTFLVIHSDETWALALKRANGGTALTAGYVLGLIGVFYINWPLWAGIGAVFGGVIDDPARYGADFMFAAMFIGLIGGLWRGRSSLIVLCASGLAALAAYHWVPGHWYIFVGAIAGMIAGALAPQQEVAP